ncbi:type II toxin-antitoxin system VapC family toxin [Methyloversatilis discipulorum]|uniref:type II toxin-antitoxin system VapC family toxin n=1 Tax=Methyloversatilis discipulorum TaxID=1119528 RepID=UPI001A42486D|nr:type II toxin-antitoxin system VapC family toxin [Methyloversatilis discipulorum]MBL8466866.1 type II toxin-antitoxin system VapC family toxin [Methyloversatilis discipulorum]
MYLLDTNVISELRKGARTNAGVLAFFAALDPQHIHLTVQTRGELRRGLENIRGRGDHAQATRLESWLDDITTGYADRILGFDLDCAQVWVKLMSPNPQHPIDKPIAIIALIHDPTVVTRNTADFAATGVKLLNPFAG